MMCCKLTEAENTERILSIFSPQTCQPKTEGALSMGGSWLEVYVTHYPGHAIIFVGCSNYPKFLL